MLLHVAGRGRDREQQQAPHSETMSRSLVFRRAHEPDGDTGLLIDESRIRANRVRTMPGVAAAVELLEIPGRDSGALEAVALRQRSRGLLRHARDARPRHRLEAGLQRAQRLAARHTVRAVIHHGESHAQVRGNPVEVEVGDGHGRVGLRGDLAREERHKGTFRVTCFCEKSARPVCRRHDMASDALRQGSDQRGHQLFAQARHLPVEPVGLQPRQQRQRDGDRDSVILCARLETIAEIERLVTLLPGAREGVVVEVGSLVVNEVLGGHRQQVGGVDLRFAPPALEVPRRRHLGRDTPVIEIEDRLIVEQDVAAPGALLEL